MRCATGKNVLPRPPCPGVAAARVGHRTAVPRRELLLEHHDHHDERLTDGGLDLAIGANSGAQKIAGELLHNLPHDPGLWRPARGIISNSSTRCDDVRADRQRESLRILSEFAQVSDRRIVAARIEPFTQVLVVRILSVCGEVAEWPKAAVRRRSQNGPEIDDFRPVFHWWLGCRWLLRDGRWTEFGHTRGHIRRSELLADAAGRRFQDVALDVLLEQ